MVDFSGRSRGFVLRVLVAFACIYFIWGSTFLAIRVAIADLPPLLMCGVRLLIAGLLLLALAWRKGGPWPRGVEWRNAILVGLMLPTVGNGGVTVAETHVPSGLVALLVGTIPLWMALLGSFGPAGVPLRARSIAGLASGFAGIALLIGPGALPRGASLHPGYALIPVLGALSWSFGSLWARRVVMPRSPIVGAGVGMLVGGLSLVALGLVSGEGARLQLASVRPQALLALLYLATFGSVIAFTAYVWLLGAVSPTAISTYAFVNPIVAMALGWLFAGEALTMRALFAAGLVIVAVVLIITTPATRARAAQATEVADGSLPAR